MENKNVNEKKVLSEQLRKKLLVYPVFGLVFVLSMYLIFKPSSSTNKQEINGFNAELPVPATKELTDNKIAAYEKQLLENKQNEKTKSLEDFTFSLSEVETIEKKEPVQKTKNSSVAAVESYKKINKELSTIYQSPTRETKEGKEEKSYNLKSQTDQAKDQYAIMEESYKLAAKYLNPTQVQTTSTPVQNNQLTNKNTVLVQPDNEKVITRLGDVTDSTFIRSFSKKRNFGFNTISLKHTFCQVNTIQACVSNNQVLIFDKSDTQIVTLRLLENIRIKDICIPKNTLLIAEAKLQSERLQLAIKNIQYAGYNIPVYLKILDLNGQEGIYIPSSVESNSVKDIAGNTVGNAGTSINLGNNAGQQLITDVSREIIQGATSYLNKKIKITKVTIKTNYRVLLINQQ